RHTRFSRDWSSDVCSSDLDQQKEMLVALAVAGSEFGVDEHVRAVQTFDRSGGDGITRFDSSQVAQSLHLEGGGGQAAHQTGDQEIGRASCRERGEGSGGGG